MKKEPMIYATGNPIDRQNRICRCGTCGIVAICTPTFDFYGFAGELLVCETCFAGRHNAGKPILRVDGLVKLNYRN